MQEDIQILENALKRGNKAGIYDLDEAYLIKLALIRIQTVLGPENGQNVERKNKEDENN